jgi:hypothetical protein
MRLILIHQEQTDSFSALAVTTGSAAVTLKHVITRAFEHNNGQVTYLGFAFTTLLACRSNSLSLRSMHAVQQQLACSGLVSRGRFVPAVSARHMIDPSRLQLREKVYDSASLRAAGSDGIRERRVIVHELSRAKVLYEPATVKFAS